MYLHDHSMKLSFAHAARAVGPLLYPLTTFLRSLLLTSITDLGMLSRFIVEDIPSVDFITLKGDDCERLNTESKVVVYLHGGAFVLRDSGDLLIAERLLPLLDKDLTGRGKSVVLASVLYPLATASDDSKDVDQYERAVQFVVRTVESISAKAIVMAVVADSAGGHLALELFNRSQSLQGNVKLCLISPWLDLLCLSSDCYQRNKHRDFLVRDHLLICREHLLGKIRESRILNSMAACIASHIVQLGIKCVAFDMDQCIVSQHSMGRLSRHVGALGDFLSRTSPSFAPLARHLHQLGVFLAIATHSDSFEYRSKNRSEMDYIIGDELVKRVLENAFPELAGRFFIVAYNPKARGNYEKKFSNKKYHIRTIAEHYNIRTNEVLLFDDDFNNVSDNENGTLFRAIQVDASTGLDVSRLWLDMKLSPSNLYERTDNIDLGFLNPLTTNMKNLRQLPNSVLLIAGTRELFYDDIKEFKARIESSEETKDTVSVEIFEADHVHAFPLLWQHPLRRFVCNILTALITRLLSIFFWPFMYKRTNSLLANQVVDCDVSDLAIRKISEFVLRK